MVGYWEGIERGGVRRGNFGLELSRVASLGWGMQEEEECKLAMDGGD